VTNLIAAFCSEHTQNHCVLLLKPERQADSSISDDSWF